METLFDLRQEPHWSYSSLSAYLSCPLKYALQYIHKAPRERTPSALPFGRAFHAALSFFYGERMRGAALKESRLEGVFAVNLRMELAAAESLRLKDGETPGGLLESGLLMLREFVRSVPADESVAAIARPFRITVPGVELPLIGETDIILRDGAGRTIVADWKTSSARWPAGKADKDLQATCFCYAMLRETGETPLFRFDVVTKTKKPVFESHRTERTADDFLRLRRLMREVERAVKAEVFPPVESSFFCHDCAYGEACRSWHRKQAA
jgi:putative RecB family exonuclease